MSGVRKAMLVAVSLLAAGAAAPASAGPAQRDTMVTATLVSETRQLVPGGDGVIGVHLKMAEGWHVYWRYAGDSGAPVLVEFDAPEGVTIGEPLWPAPERHIDGGMLVNYIYEDEVLLMFPVSVDAGVAPGTSLTFHADLDWLVCKEYCFPGSAEATLTVEAGSDAAPSSAAKAFEAARARLPRDWKHAHDEGVSASWVDGRLVFRAPGAAGLAFYPYPESEDREILPEADMVRGGVTRGAELAIGYGEDARDAAHVLGVLCVQRGPGREPVYYSVDIPGAGRVPASVD